MGTNNVNYDALILKSYTYNKKSLFIKYIKEVKKNKKKN